MNSINKTLFIPLYGKAYVSRKGLFLKDRKAEEIWDKEGFPLKGKAKSKWLAYHMGIRSAVFDRWLSEKLRSFPDSVVLHLGCGMDSRIYRVLGQYGIWYDIDFPSVIRERKKYFRETESYKMISSDIREIDWCAYASENQTALIVMEGVSMYLDSEALISMISELKNNFADCFLLMDCYTEFGAKASKYKNPINEVGVTQVYGLDKPETIPLTLVSELDLTPVEYIDQLSGIEKVIFKKVFAGKFAKKIYRLYEYRK